MAPYNASVPQQRGDCASGRVWRAARRRCWLCASVAGARRVNAARAEPVLIRPNFKGCPEGVVSLHLLQAEALHNTPPLQCTGQTGPHLLCIAHPIDCAHKRFMHTEGLISVSHSSMWSFFFLFVFLVEMFLSFVDRYFPSRSFHCYHSPVILHPSYNSLSVYRSPDFPLFCSEGHSHFSFWRTFFFFFWGGDLLFSHELFRLQIVNTVN